MIQSEIASLMHRYGGNNRGVCAVLAVDKKSVEYMPSFIDLAGTVFSPGTSDFYVEDIILKDGSTWLDVSRDVNMQVDLKEDEKLSGQNKDYSYTVSLVLPNDDFVTRGRIIRAYDNREWILIVKERTGAWRVLGSMARGCKFSAQLSTGQVGKDSNQHDCGFTWSTGEQRAYYTEATSVYSWFEVKAESPGTATFEFTIDESVIVDWGGGLKTSHATPPGVNQTIVHPNSTPSWTYRVYHRNKAKYLAIVNQLIEELNNDLPSSLEQLFAYDNKLITTASNSWTHKLRTIHLQNNAINDSTLEGDLDALDILGAINGSLRIDGQIPYQPLTPAADASRLNLVGKGWNVVYTP